MNQTMEEQYQDEEEELENERAVDNGGGVDFTAVGRFYGWPSSRIVRVSRACGGKDRHSKVLTSKGLRDRRVRLSVNTAIQFYDLQDRLGYDQPSKAVEWLLKAAASSIDELPPICIRFPDTRKQLSEEDRSNSRGGGGGDQLGFESPEVETHDGGDPQYVVTKSSATSETSKSSGFSRSRSGKVRERNAVKEKENGYLKASTLNPISQTTSFTELLNVGISTHTGAGGGGATNNSGFFMISSPTPMDYFSSGLLTPATARTGQIQLPATHFPGFSVPATEQHQSELQQFSYNLVHAMNNGSHEYVNGNFSFPSSTSSFHRGTLQSNSPASPSPLPHIQRFPDGSPPSFFSGADDHNHNHNHQFLSKGKELKSFQR